MHDLYIGIGSNLGDRQGNILAALQRLRSRAQITAVSSFYESEAAHGAEGPAYLNVAAALRSDLDAEAFKRFARGTSSLRSAARGRARSWRLARSTSTCSSTTEPSFSRISTGVRTTSPRCTKLRRIS